MAAQAILDEISEKTGWNDESKLLLLYEYIDNQQNDEALSDFLERKATEESSELTVEEAAIRLPNGRVFSLPRPFRHHDVVRMMATVHSVWLEGNHEQGFLLSDGSFCGRAPAKVIAQTAGQLLPRASKLQELYSEDVW